jgi:hypothetical protein
MGGPEEGPPNTQQEGTWGTENHAQQGYVVTKCKSMLTMGRQHAEV